MFTKQDLDNHKMFKNVIENAAYEMKGNALKQVTVLLMWYESLEEKMKQAIAEEKVSGKKGISDKPKAD